MSRHSFSRVLRYGAVLALLGAVGVQPAAARPKPGVVRPRQGFNLFSSVFGLINANNWYCGISNRGNDCVDPTGSPVIGGGFWPKGTPDQYIFNAGLQLAGLIPKISGFVWSQDTVGAYFMDPRGDQAQGDGVTEVYSSIIPADAQNWPNQAVVRDTGVYNSVLIGRNTISQQDTWVRYWDGNPTLLSGRKHPMGVLVEQRSLAWTDPAKQDIVFFIYTFYNITASDRSAYAGLGAPLADSIADIAQSFHDGVKSVLGVDIPSAGYEFDSLYAAFFSDEDVGDAGHNYSTAILPFDMMTAYKSDFLEPNFTYPPSIFGAPFRPSVGFVGFRYLKSPINPATGREVGLTLFSNTLNSSTGFPDPVGVVQLWRYLSGRINPGAGDNPCTSPTPIASHICYQAETAADTRSYQASGPFTLKPGEKATIVVAVLGAAPVAKPLEDLGAGGIGGDVAPGFPPTGDDILKGTAQPRVIDSIAGWKATLGDLNGNGVLEPDSGEVSVVSRSLLDKGILARAVFTNKFLLPFAPESPQFFLVPGDNQVTVVWSASASEMTGDPYYTVASNPASPLYDPNYRNQDVEGYRIYRGRTTGDLTLVAQFDYANTTMTDYDGAFDYGNQCAPELGVTGGCPAAGGDFMTDPQSHDIVSPFVQVLPGTGRTKLADGSVFILSADSAVTNQGFPPLNDTGVPFAYVDKSVRNSFTYYYAVTAFDVNSPQAGASSYESARVTKSITPRAGSGQANVGQFGTLSLEGEDGPLNTDQPLPTIDPSTGEFSGPMPPTDGLQLGMAAFLPDVLSDGALTLTVDSVVPGAATVVSDDGYGSSRPVKYYLTVQGTGDPIQIVQGIQQDGYDADQSATANFTAAHLSNAKAKLFGGDSSFTINGTATLTIPGDYRIQTFTRGSANNDPPNSAEAGPRWWDGAANENVARPNSHLCIPWSGGCEPPNLNLTGGKLTGVDVLWSVQAYGSTHNVPQREFDGVLAGVTRAADFSVYWGAGGTVDSVMDDTHHLPVPFSPNIRASWGFLTDASFAGNPTGTTDGNNALLTQGDGYCVPPAPTYMDGNVCDPSSPVLFQNTATLSPIAADATGGVGGTSGLSATGNGFIFYLNGRFFLMQMTALPSAGTVWHARFFAGSITGQTATGDQEYVPATRPPAVPGLVAKISYTGTSVDPTVENDSLLSLIHTVPDPYYTTDALEATPTNKVLKFVHLPAQCIVRIYSVSGILVQVLYHNDPTGGGEATWDLRNRNNQFVASGVYFYHVETPSGQQRVGRFTVIQYAQ